MTMKTHLDFRPECGQFSAAMRSRGLIHDETPKLESYLQEMQAKGEIPRAYAGFDPSAVSLQVGNLVPALLLRRAQLFGIQPVVLVGGATGMIGDPSGKKQERALLDEEVVRENERRIAAQLAQFVDMDGAYGAKIVNNYDWFKDFRFLDFLRSVGKHLSINYMLAKDSVRLRMESGISYAEFGYMMVQGYDFLHLFENLGCRIQLGGSDQWGNITTGIELIRRKHQTECYALSTPLLTDSAGNKLGKSESGTIFLDENLTSPYQFYQYWINQPDADVLRILNTLTLLTDERIAGLISEMDAHPEARNAQRVLAQELTEMVHGKEAALAAEKAAQVLFSKRADTLDLIDERTLQFLLAEVPSSRLDSNSSIELTELLVKAGLVQSKGEARRHLRGNAISVNREKVQDENYLINDASFVNRGFLLLGLGKSKLHLVVRSK